MNGTNEFWKSPTYQKDSQRKKGMATSQVFSIIIFFIHFARSNKFGKHSGNPATIDYGFKPARH
jgi:hypothetical protein